MQDTLTFNIETIGRQSLPDDLKPNPEEIDVPKTSQGVTLNTKELIQGYKMRKVRDEMRKLSLSPLTSQIICIGTKFNNEETKIWSGLEEANNLRQFCIELATHAPVTGIPPLLISFNGKSFDIMHLAVALARHDIQLPFVGIQHLMQKYSNAYHCDVRNVLTNYNQYESGTLGDWCSAFGIERPFGFGGLVASWAEAGEWENIERHCKDNVDCTYKLYKKIERFIL